MREVTMEGEGWSWQRPIERENGKVLIEGQVLQVVNGVDRLTRYTFWIKENLIDFKNNKNGKNNFTRSGSLSKLQGRGGQYKHQHTGSGQSSEGYANDSRDDGRGFENNNS